MKNRRAILKSCLTVLALLGSTATASEKPVAGFTNSYDVRFLDTVVGNFGSMPNTQLTSRGTTSRSDTNTTVIGKNPITRLSGVQSAPAPHAIWIIAAGFIGLVAVARRTKH